MSPTYLSKVERNDFKPPSEEKIKAIAQALGQNMDELLALSGRVSSDLKDIIQRNPRRMADFLRTVDGLPDEARQAITEEVWRKRKGPVQQAASATGSRSPWTRSSNIISDSHWVLMISAPTSSGQCS